MLNFPAKFEPVRGSRPTVSYRVNRVSFGDGYSQIGKDGINNKAERWALTFVQTHAEVQEIIDFIDQAAGVTLFYFNSKIAGDGVYRATGYSGVQVVGEHHSEIKTVFEREYTV